ncbi:hypothetical protein SLEP1_g26882 [Rubroshorea leprosula]|uniref:Uncharacterized protein n=1 Tax=Rubroshorea leprosula TaxID=152421 RepID=A0AAV5JU28_9ROSI|nr:hypothetical protein SLEP1_g26882 [Rubroshorea leprosula]
MLVWCPIFTEVQFKFVWVAIDILCPLGEFPLCNLDYEYGATVDGSSMD